MIPGKLLNRDNLVERKAESWRPPIFQRNMTAWEAFAASLRRFLDLQAASIWNDLKILLPQCHGSVLEVGCGAQPYRSLFPKTIRYTAIDTADANEHFGYQVPDTAYFQGPTWPVDSQTIDVVIATETLEHVEHTAQFLAEAKRVLKPDGELLLTVPFAARWHYIPYDYWRFTPSGIQTVLANAGFGNVCVYARGNEITVACYKVMQLILMLLLGECRSSSIRWLRIVAGILLMPLLVLLAGIGQISLRSRGGNDCLGYTVMAALTSSKESSSRS